MQRALLRQQAAQLSRLFLLVHTVQCVRATLSAS